MEVIESLTHEKKRSKKKSEAPELLAISPSGKLMLTADKKGTITVKTAQSGEETKDEVNWSVSAHQDRITAATFITEELVATVSANVSDACSVWKLNHDQPVVILDRPTALSSVFSIIAMKISKGFSVSCVSAEQVSVFTFKEKKLSKQKVRTADSVLYLQSKALNQIFAASFVGTEIDSL